MKKIYNLILICLCCSIGSLNAQNLFSENFDDVATLISSGGWTDINNSVPVGTELWHNGTGLAVAAYNGAADSYAEASFNSTSAAGTGNISHWLITPMINLKNGDVISFYTSSYNNAAYPDRLDLRLNTLNTLNVGSTDTSVGDFTELLLQVNPGLSLDTAAYPQDYWGQFSATISGLSGPTDCRIAFRYNVPDGGGAGINSTTIGIDAFSVDFPTSIYTPNSGLQLSVYPNPVMDKLSIDFAQALPENGSIRVYNTLGQSVISFEVNKGQTKAIFSASALSAGAYSFVLDVAGEKTKRNFIKN